MSHRVAIRNAFINLFKEKLDGVTYTSNIYNNVGFKNTPFAEMIDFPAMTVSPGPERRDVQPSRVVWGYLSLYLRIYTKSEDDPQTPLESLISDIEQCITDNDPLPYTVGGVSNTVTDYSITSISTDEGLLHPYGVGEIVLNIRYQKT